MLVILSDLHLGDGTASPDNVPTRAFDLFLDHVLDLAEHAKARKITLLFLGDIFDLLRTEHWFYPAPGAPFPGVRPAPAEPQEPFAAERRPWGEADSSAARARAAEIARRIVTTCAGQLAVLSGRPPGPDPKQEDSEARKRVRARLASPPCPIERFYLPGNHDRLARLYPEVMKIFLDALDARQAPEDPAGCVALGHGVVARHGHEVDFLNFERERLGAKVPVAADYLRTPIGDPITTECMARLSYEVRADLLRSGLPAETVEEVHERLQGVEDVRPLSAVLRWVARIGATSGLSAPVLRSLQRVAGSLLPRMLALPASKAWVRRRRWSWPGIWHVLLVKGVSFLSSHLSLTRFATLLGVVDLVAALTSGRDPSAKAALGPLGGGGDRVVFGHTHTFAHVALEAPADGRERVYLNSGTWRHCVREAPFRPGFIRNKEMTYLVFYGDGEAVGSRGPGTSYEAWNGVMMKRHEPRSPGRAAVPPGATPSS
jgi:UDP-2,3-diacylglucosamine pyrophosphatase LpxH